jgi:muconolactone D-isomerase
MEATCGRRLIGLPRRVFMEEFLVTTELRLPQGIDPDEKQRLFSAERARGIELLDEGAIDRIWRIPGAPYRTVSIRRAADVAALQDHLESLPLFNWLRIEVVPLTPHPIHAGITIAAP